MDATAVVLEAAAVRALQSLSFANAVFLCERLLAVDPGSDRAAYLLARAQYLGGSPQAAVRTLEPACLQHGPSALLYGQCCADLGRLGDAEAVLAKLVGRHADDTQAPAPAAALGSQPSALGSLASQQPFASLQASQAPPSGQGHSAPGGEATGGVEGLSPPTEAAAGLDLDWASVFTLLGSTLGSVNRKRTRDGNIPSAVPLSQQSQQSQQSTQILLSQQSQASSVRAEDSDQRAAKLLSLASQSVPSTYNCRQAIDWLNLLPTEHFNTAHALGMAEIYFERVRHMQPARMEGMDIYGTCLWHLKKPVELSFLGKELEAINRLAPQTWCVIGNYFSLKESHAQAISAFGRAVQLDPEFFYAHTLLGHEYLNENKSEEAATSFRTALRLNNRHYNAL
nr:hypothetical protein HK105_003371 [Polyrhizophydium stewartii]